MTLIIKSRHGNSTDFIFDQFQHLDLWYSFKNYELPTAAAMENAVHVIIVSEIHTRIFIQCQLIAYLGKFSRISPGNA